MKKVLSKKIKETSNAIHYFSEENLWHTIIFIDPNTYEVIDYGACPCNP